MGVETIALAGLGLSAAGAVTGAMGAYNKSKSDKAAYNYQAAVQRNNAQLAEWQAQDALSRGQQVENQQRHKTAQLKGTQRALMAARGIDLNEGSALNILTDTDFMGDIDALVIRDNAAREAWGFRQNAQGARDDASLLSSRADAESPGFAATSSLLGSAGSVASSWYNYKKG